MIDDDLKILNNLIETNFCCTRVRDRYVVEIILYGDTYHHRGTKIIRLVDLETC
jgi:hypothetical protein